MPADCNVILREDKSFVYDLDVQRGIVSSRVALLLRSAEIKPLLSDLFFILSNSLEADRGRPGFRESVCVVFSPFSYGGGGVHLVRKHWVGR